MEGIVRFKKGAAKVYKPSTCPHCGKGIDPKAVNGFCADYYSTLRLHAAFQCPLCEKIFYAVYPIPMGYSLELSDPLMYVNIYGGSGLEKDFSDEIKELSPSFVKIYNQAYKAEQNGLDEIDGIGYRRAFEFLAKDFAKSMRPEESDAIERMDLSVCIDKYINNGEKDSFFNKTAWLGNDFSHCVMSHPDFNVEDLKMMIDICISEVELAIRKKKYSDGIQRVSRKPNNGN